MRKSLTILALAWSGLLESVFVKRLRVDGQKISSFFSGLRPGEHAAGIEAPATQQLDGRPFPCFGEIQKIHLSVNFNVGTVVLGRGAAPQNMLYECSVITDIVEL